MEAIRIKKVMDSDMIRLLPVFENMIGKHVEIIVLVEPDAVKDDTTQRKAERRKPGSAIGMITIADDFEAPLPDEITEEFYK